MRRLVPPMLALVLSLAPSASAQPGRSFTPPPPPPVFTPPPRPPVFTPPPTFTPPNTGSMDFARRMADQRMIDNTVQRSLDQTRMINDSERMRRMTSSGGNGGVGVGAGVIPGGPVAPPKRVREAEPTVIVTAVKAGGLGEKAGLKVGDVLESYDGVELRATAQTVAVIKKRTAEAADIDLVVRRAKKEITLAVRPGLLGVTLVTNLPPGG